MNENSIEEDERSVLVNPNVIENTSSTRERPVYDYKRWRRLHLTLKEYEFIHSFQSQETDIGSSFGLLAATSELEKQAGENFNTLSEEEQREIRWAHLASIRTEAHPHTVRLVGWATIKGRRDIEVRSVSTTEGIDEEKYRERLNRIYIEVHESSELPPGALIHWTEDLRRGDADDPGEDYLVADLYVADGTLAELERLLERKGRKLPLEIFIQSHLFQNEIDESLAEPYHWQQFTMLSGSSNSTILHSIVVNERALSHADNHSESNGESAPLEKTPLHGEGSQAAQFSVAIKEIAISLRGISLALWSIAVVVLVSVFVG